MNEFLRLTLADLTPIFLLFLALGPEIAGLGCMAFALRQAPKFGETRSKGGDKLSVQSLNLENHGGIKCCLHSVRLSSSPRINLCCHIVVLFRGINWSFAEKS